MLRLARHLWRNLSILIRTSTLDICDLGYSFSAEAINYLEIKSERLPPEGILKGIRRFLGSIKRSLPLALRSPWNRVPANYILFFVTTKNQYDALLPLIQITPNAYVLGTNDLTPLKIHHNLTDILAAPFLIFVLIRYFQARGYQKRSMRHLFDQYWRGYGLYIYFRQIIQKAAVVVMANDHWIHHRALLLAANDEGVPSIYIQHASITEAFPPLRFSYAFLDGRDSLKKYDAIGKSSTKVFLIGIMKLDQYFRSSHNKTDAIAVCTNPLDHLDEVEKLLKALVHCSINNPLFLRPHPKDRRWKEWQNLADNFDLKLSDPRSESAMEFLNRVDVVIAGASNILLEAVLLNVSSLYYNADGAGKDHYGFLKQGLVKRQLETPTEVCQALKVLDARKSPRSQFKRYHATIGTHFEGRSAELAYELLSNLIENQQILPSPTIWSEITGLQNILAYEPVDQSDLNK